MAWQHVAICCLQRRNFRPTFGSLQSMCMRNTENHQRTSTSEVISRKPAAVETYPCLARRSTGSFHKGLLGSIFQRWHWKLNIFESKGSKSLRVSQRFFLQKFRCTMPLCAESVQSRSLRSFGCFCSLSKTQTPTMISCAASAQSTVYDPHTKFCSYWSGSRQTWALNRLASVHQIRLDRYYRSDRF